MTLRQWLAKWNMSSLKISAPYLEVQLEFNDADKHATWELYIELLTRVTTQYLEPETGSEKRALESIYEIFPLTREIIKRNGVECIEFTKIAIVILNQIIRPFTAKWHKLSLDGAFENEEVRKTFRSELYNLKMQLRKYSKMLADIANVEDLTEIEDINEN